MTRTLKKPPTTTGRGRPNDTRAWLQQGPSLADLCEAFPAEWETVERGLASLATEGPDQLAAYVAELSAPLPPARRQFGSPRAQEASSCRCRCNGSWQRSR